MKISTSIYLACFALLQSTQACTYSEQRALDGNNVIVRSMELGPGLISDPKTLEPTTTLTFHPKGTHIVPAYYNVGGSQGDLNVKNKFPFVAIETDNAMGANLGRGIGSDGMNSEGLTISTLILMASKYEPKNSKAASVMYVDFNNWVLGNMATVWDLEKALETVAISPCWGPIVPVCNSLPNMHFAISDALGNSVVLEFLDGKHNFYNNSVGTMTNDPPFQWQVQNLQTYQAFSFDQISPKTRNALRGVGVQAFPSQGFNMQGLPGDFTPPSRFVRVFYERAAAANNVPPSSMEDALSLQQAVIDSVTIPYGAVPEGEETTYEYTIWQTLKVPEKKLFGYRTYKNKQWNLVDIETLSASGLTEAVHIKMFDASNPFGLNNITEAFL